MFLVNRRYRFEEGSRRVRRGEHLDEVPQICLDVDDVTVTLTVLDRDDERARRPAEGRRGRFAARARGSPRSRRCSRARRVRGCAGAASSAKYVRIASAPARLNPSSASIMQASPSIQPFWRRRP